jgi:hypothetical protein
MIDHINKETCMVNVKLFYFDIKSIITLFATLYLIDHIFRLSHNRLIRWELFFYKYIFRPSPNQCETF